MSRYRILVAEFLGTLALVLGGVGTAVVASGMVGSLGVAMAFGLSIILINYTIGRISGAHVNPAVTIGFAVNKVFPWKNVPGYVIAQILGALLGGAILLFVSTATPGFELLAKNFAIVGYGDLSPTGVTGRGVLVMEVAMTAIISFVVMASRNKDFPESFTGIVIGAAYCLVHLVALPISNAAANPARALSTNVFVGGEALSQLWLFIVAPIIGGIIGAWLYQRLNLDS